MAQVYTAPAYIPRENIYTLFLAGAIDMGRAENWQQAVIAGLESRDDLIILNPRRVAFNNMSPELADEQMLWEFDALERANTVFMWFPGNSTAHTSFFEAGFYWQSGKLFVGADPQYHRYRYLQLMADRYRIELHSSLSMMIDRLLHYGTVPARVGK